MLRFITCGSVKDGKSTLVVRLLAFPTGQRTFTVTDVAGDEDYTRQMVTGASTADLAVILVDGRKGVVRETRWHGYLVSLLGVRHVVLAVNKMDLVAYSEPAYANIEREYREFSSRWGATDVTCIPISALHGDNVAQSSINMPWYRGNTLMHHLEHVVVRNDLSARPFRLQVGGVNSPPNDSCGIAGLIVSGSVGVGDAVSALPSGQRSHVTRIIGDSRDLETAVAGQSVTVTLAGEVDASGDYVLAASDAPPSVADRFEATIIWMHDRPMLQGRSYLLTIGAQTVGVTVAPLKYSVNVDTLEHVAAKKLELNDIGVCGMELSRPVVFEPYSWNRPLGRFVLIDRITNATVGGGILHFALRRSDNVHWQAVDVNKRARAELKGQKPCIVWFTGLSGAGKSAVANLLEKRLHALGRHTYLLDGDNVRHGLNKDLGFTEADRVENVRRVAEVAHLMADAGLLVLVSLISPFRAERRMARGLVDASEFFEVFVDTPLHVAEKRDPKGLYKKARRGELKNFTGVDSPYEAPEAPEIRIDTTRLTPEQATDAIMEHLRNAGIVAVP
jgi:bifunctional enzyme CysN/CysC